MPLYSELMPLYSEDKGSHITSLDIYWKEGACHVYDLHGICFGFGDTVALALLSYMARLDLIKEELDNISTQSIVSHYIDDKRKVVARLLALRGMTS